MATEAQKINASPSNLESRRASTISKFRRPTLTGPRKSVYMSQPINWNVDKRMIPQIQYENTYKLEADQNEVFVFHKANKILKEELKKGLSDYKYDVKTVSEEIKRITERMKFKLKELPAVRYKLVVNIILGNKSAGGISIASRALWNDKSGDTFAEANYSNDSIFAIATVYGIYYE